MLVLELSALLFRLLTFQPESLAVEQYEGAASVAPPVAQCGDHNLAGRQAVRGVRRGYVQSR